MQNSDSGIYVCSTDILSEEHVIDFVLNFIYFVIDFVSENFNWH